MNEQKKKSWFVKHKVLTVLGVIVVLIVIISASSSSKTPTTSQPAQADKSSSSSSTPAPTAKAQAQPQALLTLAGSGTKQTQTFTAAGEWDLNWTYDCSQAGGNGNFIVTVYNADGSVSFENTPVNQMGASGTDVQHYHTGGKFYLDINSECSWTVNAKG
jgi:hypothetical protein